jgi:hypothetical protein
MSAALTETEQVKLRDLEGIIERGLQTFVEVGAALTLIREQGLYRTSHPTFDEYCKERWGWSDRRARQLMEASEVVGTLAETGTIVPPENEAQAREVHVEDAIGEGDDNATRARRGVRMLDRAAVAERDAAADIELAALYRRAHDLRISEQELFG